MCTFFNLNLLGRVWEHAADYKILEILEKVRQTVNIFCSMLPHTAEGRRALQAVKAF
jgi:hypothetical protein